MTNACAPRPQPARAIAHVDADADIGGPAVGQLVGRRRRGPGERDANRRDRSRCCRARRASRPTLDPNGYTVAPIAAGALAVLEDVDERLPVARPILERLQVDFVDRLAEQVLQRMLVERVRLDELRVERDADEVPPRLRRLIALRLRFDAAQGRRRIGRRQRRDQAQRGHGLYQHPFKDNVNRVSDSILAAVMTAPRQPIELREFPRPDLPAGAVLLKTSLLGGLRHRRAPLARPPRRRAVSDHSRPRLGRRRRRRARSGDRASTARRFAKAIASCSSTCIAPAGAAARAPCTARRRAAPRAASTASPIRRTRGSSADGRRRSTSSPASASRACRTPSRSTTTSAAAAACSRRCTSRSAPRSGSATRSSCRASGAVGLSAIALARIAGASRIIAIGAPGEPARPRARDGRRPHAGSGRPRRPSARRQAVLDATHGEGADVVIEAAGAAAAISEGLDLARVGGRYVIAGPLHRRRRQPGQRAPADQPQAPRDPRLLGQRGAPLPPRALDPGAPSRRFRSARSARAATGCGQLERRARGRRSDADSEGAGRSVAVTRHTKIVATLGPASTAPDDPRRARRRAASTSSGSTSRTGRTSRTGGPTTRCARRPRAPAATSPSSRISADRRSAPDASAAASRSSSTRGTSCASPPATRTRADPAGSSRPTPS